jgi:predicted nucleic acid-binding protein
MSVWRLRRKSPLSLTHHGRVEVTNGICLAAHRREISVEALADALASLDEDLTTGVYRTADLLWRAALDRSAELSRKYSPKLGTRSLDILHVASALELGSRIFVTYDNRQTELARIVGLKVLAPTA